jgi:hypothetical protein
MEGSNLFIVLGFTPMGPVQFRWTHIPYFRPALSIAPPIRRKISSLEWVSWVAVVMLVKILTAPMRRNWALVASSPVVC